jgi:hypothetical protein
VTASEKLKGILISRKFWSSVFGIVVLIVGERSGVSAEALAGAVAIIFAYILGTGIESGLNGRK